MKVLGPDDIEVLVWVAEADGLQTLVRKGFKGSQQGSQAAETEYRKRKGQPSAVELQLAERIADDRWRVVRHERQSGEHWTTEDN